MRTSVLLFLFALGACKAADGASSDTQCQSWCAHEASALTAIAKDIEAADRAAGELDKIEVKTDADIKAAGERATALCADVRASMAHARGVAWSLSDGSKTHGGTSFPSSAPDDFEKIEKDAAACAGRSPAQLKSALVGPVRELKDKAPKSDLAKCTSTCTAKR
jgi:hypothetical protein